MKSIYFMLLTLLFPTLALASMKCPIQITYGRGKDSIQEKENKLSRILKRKGYAITEEDSDLKLHLSFKLDHFGADPTNSNSNAQITYKGKKIADVNENYCALIGSMSLDSQIGIMNMVIAGASKEGARRRVFKAIKELPDCSELNP